MDQADRVHSTPPISTPILPDGLARQQRERERALKRLSKLRKKASAEIERLMAFLDASDPYASNELEDDGDRETECEDEGAQCEDEGAEGDSEPSLGSLDQHDNQEQWAAGGRRDLEQDDGESGIADLDGLLEQIGSPDWHGPRGGMV